MRQTVFKFLIAALLFSVASAVHAETAALESVSRKLDRASYKVVYFDFDEDVVDRKALSRLKKQAAFIRGNPDIRFAVTGHTDKVGNPAYNLDLGLRRARRVVAHLVALGVSKDQLQAMVSQGERSPAVKTEERERLNRRVVTTVLLPRQGDKASVARAAQAPVRVGSISSTVPDSTSPPSTSTTSDPAPTGGTTDPTLVPEPEPTPEEPTGKPRPGNSSFGTGKPDAGGGNGDEPSGDPEGSIGKNRGGDEVPSAN